MRPDIPYMRAEMNASGHVGDAQFDRVRLTAVSGPSSKGPHAIFKRLILGALSAQDTSPPGALRGQ